MSGLNWNKAFALEQCENDPELLRELLTILKQSCSNDIRLMRQGIDSDNPSQVRCAAHSIKGAAASLGVTALRDIALCIELDAQNGTMSIAKGKISQLSGMIEELKYC
jgi:HPt (histidine-containing phosphotransfer) domain-containing protein